MQTYSQEPRKTFPNKYMGRALGCKQLLWEVGEGDPVGFKNCGGLSTGGQITQDFEDRHPGECK